MEKESSRSTRPVSSLKTPPEESESRNGLDPIEEYLKANGLPVTLENYLALAQLGSQQKFGAESADTLPPKLRDEWFQKNIPET